MLKNENSLPYPGLDEVRDRPVEIVDGHDAMALGEESVRAAIR